VTKTIILSFLLACLSFNIAASPQNEIAHLLNFVSSTDCKYERNGDMHTGEEAVAHIKKKYDYFSDDIKTTEDFIKYSTTKSKMSGDFYKIHCSGQEIINSQDWLLAELKRYRSNYL
jgi:uncharacterized protein YdaL